MFLIFYTNFEIHLITKRECIIKKDCRGKFDLILQILYDKIQIQYKTKTIAIEIKSGKTVNTKIFCQVERYLVDTDVVLMVRVPTQDVVQIHSERITNELIDLSLLRRKADKILSNSVKKVPGDW